MENMQPLRGLYFGVLKKPPGMDPLKIVLEPFWTWWGGGLPKCPGGSLFLAHSGLSLSPPPQANFSSRFPLSLTA